MPLPRLRVLDQFDGFTTGRFELARIPGRERLSRQPIALDASRVHWRTMRLACVLFAVAMVLTLTTVSTGGRMAPAGML